MKALDNALWLDPRIDEVMVGDFRKTFEVYFDLAVATNIEEAFHRLKYDDPEIDIILLNVKFEEEGNESVNLKLLGRIRQLDPDIPIVLVTDEQTSALHYAAGEAHASVKSRSGLISGKDNIQKFIADIRSLVTGSPSYDKKQRQLANDVAARYIQIESERPGTVAYWLFEEDLIEGMVKGKELEKRSTLTSDDLVNVLDIGCGTGRFAKVVLSASQTARVTCVDFSGRMLLQAKTELESKSDSKTSLERCKFRRSLAEQLPSNFGKFDIVLLGFGFPSYSPTRRVLKEAHRVLSNDGWLFASVYNHSALAYERWSNKGENDPQRPISTWIDRDRGEIHIPTGAYTQALPARTFTPSQFARELRQTGFHVGGYLSFPVLYSTLKCSEIEKLAKMETVAETKRPQRHYGNEQFSYSLWGVDKELSSSLKDKGFYTVFIASPSESALERISRSLFLHPVDTLKP